MYKKVFSVLVMLVMVLLSVGCGSGTGGTVSRIEKVETKSISSGQSFAVSAIYGQGSGVAEDMFSPDVNVTIDIVDATLFRFNADDIHWSMHNITSYRWRDMDNNILSERALLERVLYYDPAYDPENSGVTRYVKTITVTDANGTVSQKSFTIFVHKIPRNNHVPVASAGADMSVAAGTVVQLDGNASRDDDGPLALRYSWRVVSKPQGSEVQLMNADTAYPRFQADRAGVYVIELIVSDGVAESVPARVTITQLSASGSVQGVITDAVQGNAVSNPVLTLRRGTDNRTGDIVMQIEGGADGSYSIAELPAGNYTVQVDAEGYIRSYFTIVSVADQTVTGQNFSLSPTLQEGETRIVLTWREDPSDLDSHLEGPDGNGGRFHVFYGNPDEGDVMLDNDVTEGYGPETITITRQQEGEYVYYVYNFSGNADALSTSGATVSVYRGSQLIQTFEVPLSGTGLYWTVFTMNGTEITPVNKIGERPQL